MHRTDRMDRQYSSLALDLMHESYTQLFVSYRVAQMNAKASVKWRYVGTEQNPAYEGSRGILSRKRLEIWMKGPNWLSKPEMWPAVVETKPSKETEEEAKLVSD